MTQADDGGQRTLRSILVILPTWVGDFVMSTPTLRAIRNRFTDARITFLTHSNLRELVRGGDWMDECIEWPAIRTRSASDGRALNVECRMSNVECRDGGKDGGMDAEQPYTHWQLVKCLRSRRFDWAILLPNSFRAALIARISGAKHRIGYDRDWRGFLLNDRIPVKNRRDANRPFLHGRGSEGLFRRSRGGGGPLADAPAVVASSDSARGSDSSVPSCPRASVPAIQIGTKMPVRLGRYVPMPLVEYYADLAEAIGCERPDDRLELFTTVDCDESIQNRLASLGNDDRHPLIVISPGAKFGAAKCWMPERFAAVADRLIESADATVIVTCGPGEESIVRQIGMTMKRTGFVLDHSLLTLGELKSLIRRSDLLICNDAGPRHIAKAFDVPVVTVFGPTHPDWTATSYEKERIVRIDVDCGPCQQRLCPLGHHQCMTGVSVDMVFAAASALLRTHATQHAESR